MRKISIIILCLAMLTACAAHTEKSTENHRYALTTKVIALDHESDVVTVEDFNGNAWTFYGVEDWQIGDCAALTINDSGTEKIMDDTIESARYSGWIVNR